MPEKKIDFTAIDSFEIDDHLVLLNKGSSRIQVLNPLASIIWHFKSKGMSNLEVANEVSAAFNIPTELALQDVQSIHTQWTLDLATPLENIPKANVSNPVKAPCEWQSIISVCFSFPRYSIRVNFDSLVIAEKVRKMLPTIETPETDFVDMQLDIISHSDAYLIVKDGLVLEQVETESYCALIVFQNIVDLASKHNDWMVILHAAGVAWQGEGIVFPALGGSGKTTLTAALIKQGFDYINDDVIPLLRQSHELIPLPICMSIKSGSWPLLQSRYPDLATIDAFGSQEPRIKYLPPPTFTPFSSPLFAKHIIVLNYQPGALPTLEPVSIVLGLQAIVEGESLLHLPINKEDLSALIEWLKPLNCYRFTYDLLDPAVDLLREFFMNR